MSDICVCLYVCVCLCVCCVWLCAWATGRLSRGDLADRRLARADKLTLAWRDLMLNEWASTLYESRRRR